MCVTTTQQFKWKWRKKKGFNEKKETHRIFIDIHMFIAKGGWWGKKKGKHYMWAEWKNLYPVTAYRSKRLVSLFFLVFLFFLYFDHIWLLLTFTGEQAVFLVLSKQQKAINRKLMKIVRIKRYRTWGIWLTWSFQSSWKWWNQIKGKKKQEHNK